METKLAQARASQGMDGAGNTGGGGAAAGGSVML